MNEILEKVENYWGDRCGSYCKENLEELTSFKRDAWVDLINENAPKVPGRKLRVLDIGTGPGFLAIIMDSLGYDVTAVDYTEAMLQKARKNANDFNTNIDFRRMDAQNLLFEDDTFDLIVSRNLTWDLEKPEQAYRQWHRVLSPGGRLLNFDANWYLYLFDQEKRKEYEQSKINILERGIRNYHNPANANVMENIARNLPLSKINRPAWDVKELDDIGLKKVIVEKDLGSRVWDEVEKVNYRSTPMFMIRGDK